MLDVLGLGAAELSLVLVSDRVMHDLNRSWRGKDRPTDVLAFAQGEEGIARRLESPRRRFGVRGRVRRLVLGVARRVAGAGLHGPILPA